MNQINNRWNKEKNENDKSQSDNKIVHISSYLINEPSLLNEKLKSILPEYDLHGTFLNEL